MQNSTEFHWTPLNFPEISRISPNSPKFHRITEISRNNQPHAVSGKICTAALLQVSGGGQIFFSTQKIPGEDARLSLLRDAMGGWKKEGGGKKERMTPLPKKGFGPPSYGTFSTLLRTEQTWSSFGRVQNFPERARSLVGFPPPIRFCTPPISRPNLC